MAHNNVINIETRVVTGIFFMPESLKVTAAQHGKAKAELTNSNGCKSNDGEAKGGKADGGKSKPTEVVGTAPNGTTSRKRGSGSGAGSGPAAKQAKPADKTTMKTTQDHL